MKIDGGPASPIVLAKKVFTAAYVPSYQIGEIVLRKVGGIDLTGRGLNKTAVKIGTEMTQDRDARVGVYFNQPLPRKHVEPKTPIPLACVSVDGGRMQTRIDGGGKGVHGACWRETKNALFLRMKSESFDLDPHPQLPACYADREGMKTLLSGVAESNPSTDAADESIAVEKRATAASKETPQDPWRPESLYRTCISSLSDSNAFGRMMEVEADARGFYHARKKAFVSDGLPYNWTIQSRHFRDFTPILDFVHAIERLYEASRCVNDDPDRRWLDHLRWARLGWSGKIDEVIAELKSRQEALGFPQPDCEKTDKRKIFADAIGYFENNVSRMNYPEYRRSGLPTSSSHMESLVKEINARVKGTEKFWNAGPSGEAILQLRSAALSDDDRLTTFLSNRPGHPFHPNVPHHPATSTAG